MIEECLDKLTCFIHLKVQIVHESTYKRVRVPHRSPDGTKDGISHFRFIKNLYKSAFQASEFMHYVVRYILIRTH